MYFRFSNIAVFLILISTLAACGGGSGGASGNTVINLDADNDGVVDSLDAFPNDASETADSDGDGVGDNADAFPNDETETADTDNDGVGDNADEYPEDPSESADTDGDGVGNNADAFPNDATETVDTDSDGVGDNADQFPTNPAEAFDTDQDGVGDNTDVFPSDPTETIDSDKDGVGDNTDAFDDDPSESRDTDNDGVGDNADVFPSDPTETIDSDKDGVGDNSDVFPNDPSESLDTDNDGVGDNADAFPNDATESEDFDNDGVGNNADDDDDNDGIADNDDAFPFDDSEWQDLDGDGVGDNDDSNIIGDLVIAGSRPRITMTAEQLELAISRATGDNAISPYKEWYTELKSLQDAGTNVGLQGLAFLYRATNDRQYLDKLFELRPTTGVPRTEELTALDMVYDEVSDEIITNIMDRVADGGRDVFIYQSVPESQGEYSFGWGYHSAFNQKDALAYALLVADHPLELNKDEEVHPFDARNFLLVARDQMEEGGHFYEIERRIAGDMTYNTALPGSYGGIYDNFAYDRQEEADSATLYWYWHNATGSEAYKGALHEKHRGDLYLSMGLPFTEEVAEFDGYCEKEGTITGELPRIWDIGTTPSFDLNDTIKVFMATLFQEPTLQWFVENGTWLPNCTGGSGLTNYLLYYDNQLQEVDRNSLPTAKYYSGPGLSVMRTDWNTDAAYGLFMAGEGISRRYQDANSFVIHRNDFIIKHAGRRIRFNDINDRHHWYHELSTSKNIIKVFDPEESFDVNADGTKSELHSGTPLVNSDNYGGQIPTHEPSTVDDCYIDCKSDDARSTDAYMFAAVERADITKYEHDESEFTYTVGDATASYTDKVEYIEREFLFLHPDTFVIFDRVKVSDPSFRKVWTIHTVAEPEITGASANATWGKKSLANASESIIYQNENTTYINTLWPQNNNITTRGGDSEFIKQQALADITSTDLDIPRWLELYVNGSDVEGSVTITGATEDNSNDSEVVTFDGREKTFFKTRDHTIQENSITVENVNWKTNQWAGYRVKSGDIDAVITSNTSDTLVGTWSIDDHWQVTIYAHLANTSKYWTRVDSITSSDMDIDDITVSVPHYFDTEDVSGQLHTFTPHSDGKSDPNYLWDPTIGQYTMEVEATDPSSLQNFVHTIALKDPDIEKPASSIVDATDYFSITAGEQVVVFAKSNNTLSEVSITYPSMTSRIRLFNLQPETSYFVADSSGTFELDVSLEDNGGVVYESSAMGVISIHKN